MFLTIRYLIADLQFLFERKEHLNLGGKRGNGKTLVSLLLQVVTTITVLVTCIPIAMKGQSGESKTIAHGLLGMVVGYWLR